MRADGRGFFFGEGGRTTVRPYKVIGTGSSTLDIKNTIPKQNMALWNYGQKTNGKTKAKYGPMELWSKIRGIGKRKLWSYGQHFDWRYKSTRPDAFAHPTEAG